MTEVRVAIVGGGITGLAAAAWLEHDHGMREVLVLEEDARSGGKIQTRIEDGYVLEGGPQGFLDNAPDTLELARLAGLERRVIRAADASADRFIVRAGALRRVPASPLAFLGSDILPLAGRLRVLGEPLARRRPAHDETVFEFARRRIGRQAAEVMVDAMVTGVFAGDSRRLSLAATFPRMAAMEAEHGSLTRALVARMREARRAGRSSGGPAGPGGTLSSFPAGLAELPAALEGRLGERLQMGNAVLAVERAQGRFALDTARGAVSADAVLLATPADRTARLLKRVAPQAAEPLLRIGTAPIAVVMTCYAGPLAFGRPVRGFGFLVPSGESLPVLGTLFCHSIFSGQVPPGTLLLRTMLGGARDPSILSLDDGALLDRTRGALRSALGGDPDPDRVWVVRWPEGISQYTVGHLDRVAAAEVTARGAGVEIAGSPFRGVSVNDCIRQARAAASRIAQRLRDSTPSR